MTCSRLIIAFLLIAGLARAESKPPEEQAKIPAARQTVEDLVFAVRKPGPDGHWYANFGYYAEWSGASYFGQSHHKDKRVTYVPGGRLVRLNVKTGEAKILLDDPRGGVRDPVVHYDGKQIIFSYRKGDEEHFHLWRINADGTGLAQLTDGDYDDIEPCWMPDDSLVFVSSRARRWVNCWVTQVGVLYRCDADGSDIRRISGNVEHDNTPWPLPDGRILHQRWEYVDRSQVHYHHLWTMNPDGTNQTVYFGNQTAGTLMIDAKPIPGTNQVISLFSPGHGCREHAGFLTIVDPRRGPDDNGMARRIHPDVNFRDPYPLTRHCFLTAHGATLQMVDDDGKSETIYALSEADREAGFECHEPRPLMVRRRERIIPSRVALDETHGRLFLADIYSGRNMEGVEPGEIKKLLILESLPKPINYTGGMDPLTYAGSFTLERALGTVPVEEDGSAYFEVPALRPLVLVALDENDLSVKRMQSFLTVQPGETTGCVGCHEQRTRTFLPSMNLDAMQRHPARVEPVEDCPDVFDFPRDVQPILDRLCADCHGYEKTERGGPYAGKLILSGDRGPMFSHAYYHMTIRGLYSDGRNLPKSNYAPRKLGSGASKILTMLDGSHYGAKATNREKTILRLWIEVGAPYPGTYGALGGGSIGGYAQNNQTHTDYAWPETKTAAEAITRRCDGCHQSDRRLPKALSDENGLSFWQPSMADPRLQRARHIVFNLSRPEKSLVLLAPLSKEAGGWGLCHKPGDEGPSKAVFADKNDADYQRILAMIAAGTKYLGDIKRFDMPGYSPPAPYVREMKRYGVLEENAVNDGLLDPYALDEAYWRSFWLEKVEK